MSVKTTLIFILGLLFSYSISAQCNGAEFEEENGIVVIQAENTSLVSSWRQRTSFSGYTGSGYITWTGSQNFNTPGVGIIEYEVYINNPGTYRFNWRTRVGEGSSTTEHNDTWLRIQNVNDFYGEQGNSRVYPRGSGKSPNPEGASSNNWFKIYMNSLNWQWKAVTSDFDAHDIYFQVSSPRVITIQLSARSRNHLIDRIVLYKESQYSASSAQQLSRGQTLCDGSTAPPPEDEPTTNEIKSLTLVNANTGAEIGNITEGISFEKENLPSSLSILAKTDPSDVGSVSFDLTGPIDYSKNEGSDPYYLFGDIGVDPIGRDFPAGNYNITANPNNGSPVSFNFSITETDQTDPDPPASGNETGVVRLVLVNANNNTDVAILSPGLELLESEIPSSMAIRADTDPIDVGAVQIDISGPINSERREGLAPYYSFGDIGIDPIGRSFPTGTYNVSAIPNVGNPMALSFSIVEETLDESEGVTFTLVNANTDSDVRSISNGSNITFGDNRNIRASTTMSGVESVYLSLTGALDSDRVENVAPYALFGDTSGDYFSQDLPNGSYTLQAIFYSGNNRSGSILTSGFVNFTVGGSTSKTVLEGTKTIISPNPIDGSSVNLKFSVDKNNPMEYQLISSGFQVLSTGSIEANGTDRANLSLKSLEQAPSGIYYLVISDGVITESVKIVKE